MKKYLLVVCAAVMAVAFSSFSPDTSRSQDEYSFQDINGWHEVDASEACAPGTDIDCTIDNPLTPTVPNDMVQLYKSRLATEQNKLKYDD